MRPRKRLYHPEPAPSSAPKVTAVISTVIERPEYRSGEYFEVSGRLARCPEEYQTNRTSRQMPEIKEEMMPASQVALGASKPASIGWIKGGEARAKVVRIGIELSL